MTLRWFIAGCRGQLGRALAERVATEPRFELVGAVGREANLLDRHSIVKRFDELALAPDVVVNAAALTQVDRCEREPAAAARDNAQLPAALAEACAERRIRLVHVSTDYVFAGDSQRAYREHDEPRPLNVYGRSKLEGERRVLAALPDALLVRTSWLFGRGRNFVAAILAQAEDRRAGRASGPLRVVDDQHGRPTYARELAGAIVYMVERAASGLYHVANRGVASWWDLARASLDAAGYAALTIERIRTDELALAAARPLHAVLDCAKAEAFGVEMSDWRDAVRSYLASPDAPRAQPRGGA